MSLIEKARAQLDYCGKAFIQSITSLKSAGKFMKQIVELSKTTVRILR